MQKEKNMRNFRKILIAACVLALLVAGCVVFALAKDDEPIGTVEELVKLIETAEGEHKTDEENYLSVVAIAEYLDGHKIEDESYTYTTAIIRAHKVTVDCARTFIDAVYAPDVDDNTALNCISKASELLGLYDFPESTGGLSEAKTKYNEALVQTANIFIAGIDENIETTLKTATNQIAINKMKKLMQDCEFFGDENPLTAVEEKFAGLLEAHENAVAKNLEALDSKNSASSYDLPIFYEEDWESRSTTTNPSIPGWTFDRKGIANEINIEKEKNGNKYLVHRYLEKDNPQGTYAQINLSQMNVVDAQTKGLVFEFDIATFSEIPPAGIVIETGSIRPSTFPPPYLCFTGNGDISSDKEGTNVLLKEALVVGQWLHIILVVDPVDFVYKLYVAGEYVGSYDAKYNGIEKFEHGKVAFRLSGGASKQGDVAYDNFLIYSGDNYRNHDRLTNMNDAEKFIFFVGFITNEANDVISRKDTYYEALNLLETFWNTDNETGEPGYAEGVVENEALKTAVDTFVAFDIDSVIAGAKLQNLEQYMALVEELLAVERSYDSVNARQGLVNQIADFALKNVGLIDTFADNYPEMEVPANPDDPLSDLVKVYGNGIPDYEEYVAKFNTVKEQIEYDKNAKSFLTYIANFQKATSLTSMNRYYNRAKASIDEGKIDLSLILDESAPYRENFMDLVEAYNVYLNSAKKVDDATKDANSDKIIKCMNKINSYRTVEEWEANSEIILEYVNIVKSIVLYVGPNGELNYNPNVNGTKAAVDFFNDVYGYFFNKIQNDHVAYMTDILDRISATDSYISKIGMISLMGRYIDTNEIDFNDERIITLINNMETCKSELELRREDYAMVLIQNSNYFISLVENMRTAKTYVDQKTYFEQAAVYYFSMDVSVEGARRAVKIFDEYKDILDTVEDSTVKFLESVSLYKASEGADEKYAALVECYYHAQYAELSYEGVADAMAEYQAAYNEYMGYATAVNADLEMSGGAVGSLRTNCGITTIIAIVIKKIFGV